MAFLAEQHLVAAKLVRRNGATRTGAERELFIRKSNSFVVCVRLMAKDRGGICLDNFDWWSLTPDWSVVDEQVLRLAPPHIDGPSLVPNDCEGLRQQLASAKSPGVNLLVERDAGPKTEASARRGAYWAKRPFTAFAHAP